MLVHVNETFWDSNLRLPFKASPMISKFCSLMFYRRAGSAWLKFTLLVVSANRKPSAGTTSDCLLIQLETYLHITSSELTLPSLPQFPLCADVCPLLLPDPVSAFSPNIPIFAPFCSSCLSKLGRLSKTQLSHLLRAKYCLCLCSRSPPGNSKVM